MIIKQGRTETVKTIPLCIDGVWDGPAYAIYLGDPHGDGVPIGICAYRTARSTKWPGRELVWHATTDTKVTSKTRWWSGFDRTDHATLFLMGMYLGRRDSTPA